MNWDLTSYFPRFDGPEMRRFKEALRRDIASLKDRAASLLPLNDENASGWEDVLTRNEALIRRMSHLSSYVSCLAASDGRNEDYLKEEARLASTAATPHGRASRMRRPPRSTRSPARVSHSIAIVASDTFSTLLFSRRPFPPRL